MKRASLLVACITIAACQRDPSPSFRSIEPVCVDDEAVPDDAWACSDPLTLDCNEATVPEQIYVQLDAGQCDEVSLQDIPGPFPPGEYDIVVVDGNNGDAPVCSTALTVTDAVAPVVETELVSLWPPNHKMHDVTLADCIAAVDDCDENWTAVIDYVTSDEPDDDNGDGHTEGDVVLVGTDAVQLRSERQGGGNGRVYTIGFTVTDGSGNATATSCLVEVDHDQGHEGEAIDDGEAYRVEPR